MHILLGKRILFVTAHPDDESFLAAGTMHKNLRFGGKCALVCATFGERGKGHMHRPVTTTELKKIRKVELEKICHFFKVKNLFCFNLPDGELCDCEGKLETKISAAMKKFEPEVVVSFGPDGVTGHKDHISIGKISLLCAKRDGVPFVAFAAGPNFRKEFAEIKAHRRKFGVYAKGIRLVSHNLRLKADPGVKMKALKAHASQSLFENYSKKTIREILNYDFFRI